ncbi:hypothetical protein DP117_20345 [Brasilonema sp. UFV-L1]|nr:hypothetical protein [Brasilonema sp. UFV-L1]
MKNIVTEKTHQQSTNTQHCYLSYETKLLIKHKEEGMREENCPSFTHSRYALHAFASVKKFFDFIKPYLILSKEVRSQESGAEQGKLRLRSE